MEYREAYDKIVDAYFKDKLDPYNNCACFIGNLLNGHSEWAACRTENSIVFTREFLNHPSDYAKKDKQRGLNLVKLYGYNAYQITAMENNFLKICETYREFDDDYEEILFAAMSSTLDMLKKIHEENGEVIDSPIFKKRILQTA